jgi:hypothetical protein
MRVFASLLLLVFLIRGLPTGAAEPPAGKPPETPPEDPGEALQRAEDYAKDGIEKLFRSFEMLLDAVPYGAPYVDDKGNIVIPRKPAAPGTPGRSAPSRT